MLVQFMRVLVVEDIVGNDGVIASVAITQKEGVSGAVFSEDGHQLPAADTYAHSGAGKGLPCEPVRRGLLDDVFNVYFLNRTDPPGLVVEVHAPRPTP